MALFALMATACTALAPVAWAADKDTAPIQGPAAQAPQAPRAQQAVLLAAARAGSRLVAVGERGIVLLSDDGGKAWRQAETPVNVTLTAVRFASATQGWATGHAGVILATDDGGTRWRKQLEGAVAAASALQQARNRLAAATVAASAGGTASGTATATASSAGLQAADVAAATKAVAEAQRLVADGPDKPFFDLWFSDAKNGFAVGAYNLFMRTQDGSATWVAALDRLPNAKGSHLYAISGQGKNLYIAGEQGLLLRSRDGGEHFEPLSSPYAGSFFTLALLPGGELVAAGLRGNAFRSADQGNTWQPITGLPPLSWVASAVAEDGTVWLGNQAGQVFASRDGGQGWTAVPPQHGRPAAPLTGLLAIGPRSALTTTLRGLGHVVLGLAQAQETTK